MPGLRADAVPVSLRLAAGGTPFTPDFTGFIESRRSSMRPDPEAHRRWNSGSSCKQARSGSRAIQGVAHVTEQSAAGSEEMASSSEELGAQAGALRELVGQFTIGAGR